MFQSIWLYNHQISVKKKCTQLLKMCFFFVNHCFLKFLKTEERCVDIKEKTPAEDGECSDREAPVGLHS